MLASLPPRSALLLALTLAGCASTVDTAGPGGGGGHASTSSSSSTSASSSSSSSSSASSSSASSGVLLACSGPDMPMPPGPCVPIDPGCKTDHSVCGAFSTFAGASSFALKMVHFTMTLPTALASGTGQYGLDGYQGISAPECSYPAGTTGAGWLLAFDGAAGQVTVGYGETVPGGSPFHFLEEDVGLIEGTAHVAPVTVGAPIDASCGVATSAPIDVNLPLQVFPTSALNFPFRQLSFHDVALTPDHNCIGHYDVEALDPAKGCPVAGAPTAFVDGGSLDGFLPLEDADLSLVADLSMSLCVFLTGDPSTYADGKYPQRCARDGNGHIVFPGDWCAATNQPATAACHDAMRVSGTFSAVGVLVQ